MNESGNIDASGVDFSRTTGGGVDLRIRLDPVQAASAGDDGLLMAGYLWEALAAMAELRVAGRPHWPDTARDPEERIQTVYDLDAVLIPKLEGIRAALLRALKAGGASYGDLAAAMGGVARSTAKSRMDVLAAAPHPLEDWARGEARWTPGPGPGGLQCDHRSVGVDIVRQDGARLLLRRHKPPVGFAPAAGHVDAHGTPEDAAREETAEELGLTVTALELITGGWQPNRCRRRPAPGRAHGHDWSIYRAQTTGEIAPRAGESQDVDWYTPGQVQALADRTAAHARGSLNALDFQAQPGLEPIWCDWYQRLGVVQLAAADLDLIRKLYR